MNQRTKRLRDNCQTPPEAERQRCEVWTRVMGYHRPVSSFNKGKIGEFRERKFFKETVAYDEP